MLQQKSTTKREKKEASKKKLGILFIILGLFLIAASIFFLDFLSKGPVIKSPLSENQKTTDSKLKDGLREKKIKYLSIETLNDLAYLVRLDNDSEVIIDPKKDIFAQLSSLQLIERQLKIEGKTFSRLDFRYQKPVITF